MLPRALRAALLAIVTIALWTVARPARAMVAPMCDDRGATMMVPPPTLQAPDVVLAQAHTTQPCDGEELLPGSAVAPGHAPPVVPASTGDSALLAAAPIVPPPGIAYARRTLGVPWTGPSGAKTRVERPPRA